MSLVASNTVLSNANNSQLTMQLILQHKDNLNALCHTDRLGHGRPEEQNSIFGDGDGLSRLAGVGLICFKKLPAIHYLYLVKRVPATKTFGDAFIYWCQHLASSHGEWPESIKKSATFFLRD